MFLGPLVLAFRKAKIFLHKTAKTKKNGWSVPTHFLFGGLEAAPGFEPGIRGFADRCLTTWLCRHEIDGIEKNSPETIRIGAGNGI